MKILHILDRSFPNLSGYASRAHYIIQHQKQLGLTPFVLTSFRHQSATEEDVLEGEKYFRMPSPKQNFLFRLPVLKEILEVHFISKRIEEIVKKEGIDILHAHSPAILGLAASKAGKRMRIKVVYEIRAFWEDAAAASHKYSENSLKYKLVKSLETHVCKKVDQVVTIAEGLRNDLIERGLSAGKIHIVPNGVDHLKFLPTPINTALANKLGAAGKTVIGYIGTFFDFEGIDNLIEVMFSVARDKPESFFLLVGGGETETVVREKFKIQNLPNVCYAGRVPHKEVLDYYSLIDIFVYPRKSSRVTELTTPLKPLEALAMGKAVICSSVGGLIELVGKDNALFFPPGNKEKLKKCIVDLFENAELRAEFGEKGKAMVLRERAWSQIAKKYVEIYKMLQSTSQ
ncbi:glycosyltransferase [Candidatus Parcubacteria bacterium]|nr:MAG: glycosyltransferase [Candidatus Parcubacteria bacterium]